MEYKAIAKGVEIPALGLGTWRIGGGREADSSRDAENIAAISKAVALGYTLIDTAELYGAGHTEELVGKAIEGTDRSRLFIITKVMAKNMAYDDLIESARGSLGRLGTDHFDLYLLHFPNKDVQIAETMRALDYLVEKRMTRFIGVSNFSVEEMEEAQKHTKNKIVANQVQYSLGVRDRSTYCDCTGMESEIIPYCQKNDILVIADRPLQKGMLIGKPNLLLDRLCRKYQRTRAQIALNWLISKKNVIAITMSTDEQHLKENLGAMGWKLDEEDIRLLDNEEFYGDDK